MVYAPSRTAVVYALVDKEEEVVVVEEVVVEEEEHVEE